MWKYNTLHISLGEIKRVQLENKHAIWARWVRKDLTQKRVRRETYLIISHSWTIRWPKSNWVQKYIPQHMLLKSRSTRPYWIIPPIFISITRCGSPLHTRARTAVTRGCAAKTHQRVIGPLLKTDYYNLCKHAMTEVTFIKRVNQSSLSAKMCMWHISHCYTKSMIFSRYCKTDIHTI